MSVPEKNHPVRRLNPIRREIIQSGDWNPFCFREESSGGLSGKRTRTPSMYVYIRPIVGLGLASLYDHDATRYEIKYWKK
jgi:hypothetical protein